MAMTRLHIWLYTILLVLVTLLPYLVGMSGLVYLVAALLFGGRFLHHAWRLWRHNEEGRAIRTFLFSITYLMALFAALLLDHYLPLIHAAVT